MKAFQKVGPQLPEFSYPFIPRGKTPTCLNSSSHHVVSRRFFITSFNLPIVPLKRGPIRWSGFCRHSSVTPPVISQHLFSVLSLYDDVLGTSCIDPLSVFSYFSAELTMYGWLCEQRGREFYIGAIAFFFFFGWHMLLVLSSWDLKSDLQWHDQIFFLTIYTRCEERTCETGPWECILNFLVVTVRCQTWLSAYTHTQLNDLYPPHSCIFPFVYALLKLPLKTFLVLLLSASSETMQ